jgi:hypothetical protein
MAKRSADDATSPVPKRRSTRQAVEKSVGNGGTQNGNGTPRKKQILLNAFDMSTVGHLSPGQWKVGLIVLEV